jgi:hypothetical protein
MDRLPTGDEGALFNAKPATEYDEHWVAIDVPKAQKIGSTFLDAFKAASSAPWLELP